MAQIYFVVNLTALALATVFLFSSPSLALMMLLRQVEPAELLLSIFAGIQFWHAWCAIIRHLEDRWKAQTISSGINEPPGQTRAET